MQAQVKEVQVKELKIQDMLLQNQIITLVKELNAEQNTIAELTDHILYNIFCIYKNTNYLSQVYKLIFYAFKQKPELAYSMLSGFIQFGQSPSGNQYKPLLDYFAIEAFNGLLKMGGWAILKPCIVLLRSSIYNFSIEPLFKHIIERIVIQIKTDMNDIPYNSDLCCYLPREKSFVWGWVSHNIARAYYNDPKYKVKCGRGEKKMRKYMMLYRKLITHLRKNTLEMMRINAYTSTTYAPTAYASTTYAPTAYAPEKIEESWAGISNTLAAVEYQWAADIVDKCIYCPAVGEKVVDISACEVLRVCELVPVIASANEVIASKAEANANANANEVANEVAANEVAANEVAANEVAANANEVAANANEVAAANEVAVANANEVAVANANEVVAVVANANEVAEPVKNTGWLYSLFGWA